MLVSVPATIMQSDWRGEGRRKMTPKLLKSWRYARVCIISTAQQARPKVMEQIEPRRAQFMRSSTLETTNSAALNMGVRRGGEARPRGGEVGQPRSAMATTVVR